VNNGELQLAYCSTEVELTDILTKTIRSDRFVKLRGELGFVTYEYLN